VSLKESGFLIYCFVQEQWLQKCVLGPFAARIRHLSCLVLSCNWGDPPGKKRSRLTRFFACSKYLKDGIRRMYQGFLSFMHASNAIKFEAKAGVAMFIM